jgi:hypothetical protein
LGKPHGVARKEAAEQARECEGWGQCLDDDHFEFFVDAKSYVAKCQARRCVVVRR